MIKLAESYRIEADKIKWRGSVWTQSAGRKWYHTYDKDEVDDHIDALYAEADRLESE